MAEAATIERARRALDEGRMADVEAAARAVLASEPSQHEAFYLLSAARWHQGAREEGLALVQMAIDGVPGAPDYWFGLAWCLEQMERLDEAFDACSRCLQLAPAHQPAREQWATLLRRTGRFEEALAYYDCMEARGVPIRALHLHRAVALGKLGRYEAALPSFRRSIAEEGLYQSTHWEFSGPLLILKQFEEGWRSYEHRFDAPEVLHMDCAKFPGVPRWRGEPLRGKTILLHREQGLGDQVMFASMIPDLLARGARVRIDVAPPLRELFAQSFPGTEQVGAPQEGPPMTWADGVDFEAPLGSLATVLRNSLDAFPAQPYLKAADATCAAWRDRLEADGLMAPGLLRVGIVWTVNPAPGNYGASKRMLQKQMPLARFKPLILQKRGCATALVSLSNNPVPEVGFEVHDYSERLTSLHETAALAQHMDLVITVDTSVAHVAAGLGKDTWILLPAHADWRWGDGDETSYWYAKARLFRQPSAGDWAAVLDSVAMDLSAFMKQRMKTERHDL